jgi:hypothetical protein
MYGFGQAWQLVKIQVWRGIVPIKGLSESSVRARALRTWNSDLSVLQKAARIFSRCAWRQANWIAL